MKTSKLLFFDWRHLQCGNLAWLTPDGTRHSVSRPPEPQVPMRAEPRKIPRGLRLEAQPATKTDKVDDWKGWGRTIWDQGRYRSWYFEINGHAKLGSGARAHDQPPESVVICGVESTDGFAWSAPRRCPIQIAGHEGFDGLTFFIDPAAPPAQRYKFVYCARITDERIYAKPLEAYLKQHPRYRDSRISAQRAYGMFAAVSPNGVQWTALPEPLMLHPSDTDTTVFRDEELGRYVMYTRMMREDRRWVGRAEAEDFEHWGPVEPVLWPRLDDPPDYDIYLNGYSRYPGHPAYQLMFPMYYFRATERSEVRLCSSSDGLAWNQVPGGPVIAPGPPGAWDSEFIGSGKDLVPFGPGRIATPYSGTPYPHKYPRWPAVWDAWNQGWAWWPEDRLCALKADQEGECWTLPVTPAGRQLRLNLRTPSAGLIRVGVEGLAGRTVEDCDPLWGDRPDQLVTWKGQPNIDIAETQPLTLHLQLRCAELFSISFV
ncbi:MAG: hypothetical protein IT369_11050 [Candidatus Latescibacteria bacterium]|nr:hypothetical protein [Candidatus Latescibacterota bacterium]